MTWLVGQGETRDEKFGGERERGTYTPTSERGWLHHVCGGPHRDQTSLVVSVSMRTECV